MIIPDNSNDSLLELLVQPTEIKNSNEVEEVKPNYSDFEEEEATVPENTETESEPDPTTEKPLTKAQCKSNADAFLSFFDGAACLVLPTFYKKRLFGSIDKFKQAERLAKRLIINKNIVLSEDETELINLFSDFQDFAESLELQDDERELISKPLAEVLYKHQKSATPETMLMIAIGTVYIPKILPLIFNK